MNKYLAHAFLGVQKEFLFLFRSIQDSVHAFKSLIKDQNKVQSKELHMKETLNTFLILTYR